MIQASSKLHKGDVITLEIDNTLNIVQNYTSINIIQINYYINYPELIQFYKERIKFEFMLIRA